jgi:hypothetical protein
MSPAAEPRVVALSTTTSRLIRRDLGRLSQVGSRLGRKPIAVFLAIAFCAWVWSPIGAFLAVLLLIAQIAPAVIFGHALSRGGPELPS